MPKKSAKKYYRKITEGLPRTAPKDIINNLAKVSKLSILGRHITVYFIVVLVSCAAFLLVVASYLLFTYEGARRDWLATRDNFLYWQEVAILQKNSPDAYYQAGFYAVKLGNKREGYIYLQKAVDLDPGFEAAKTLLQQLTKTTN